MKKVLALLLIPLLASACIRVNNVPDGSDDIFARLVEEGVTILACPACMKVSGIEESDLRKGVKIAEKEKFLDFTKGRILTLDY